MDIDMPLDSVIAKKRQRNKTRGARGGRGGPNTGNTRRTVSNSDRLATRQKYTNAPASTPKAAAASSALSTLPGDGSKIVVSNLPEDVTEAQIKELFASTVGVVRRVSLAYNANRQSTGVATIEFKTAGDGTKAFQAYNNRLIDQKRPMKVEIIVDPTRIPPPPLSSRVQPAPAQKTPKSTANKAQDSTEDSGRGKAGNKRGKRRGGKRGGSDRPAATAEELDAQMDEYIASGSAPASAAAPSAA